MERSRFQALAGDIVLYSWARHFIPVLLSTQEYKWASANWPDRPLGSYTDFFGPMIILTAKYYKYDAWFLSLKNIEMKNIGGRG